MTREEQIKMASEIIANGCSDKLEAALIQDFPELKESEDERIRKELYDFIFDGIWHNAVIDNVKQTRKYERWLDYLEKQKEQKPAQDEIEREYVRTLKSLISDFLRGKDEVDREYYQQIYDWLDGRHIEQKPAEWSEEDYIAIKDIDMIIRTSGRTEHNKKDLLNWLQSLRPQPHKGIYQAVKHNLAIKFMNYLDENRPKGKMCLSNAECEDIDKAFKENDLNKIMRYYEKYRPNWKPTEEQIGALNYAYGELFKREDVGHNILGPLQNLIDTLSKL